MSILLVKLIKLIAIISNNLRYYVTEDILVWIHLLPSTYVLIFDASIINRYEKITDCLWL